MTKAEFIKAVAQKTEISQKDIRTVLDAEQEVLFENLKEQEVKMFDGITFTSVYKEAHNARNPLTGETVSVPAKYAPKVKAH